MRFEVKEKVKIRIQEVLNLEVEKVRRQKEVTIPKINFQELSSVKDLMLEGQGTGTGYFEDNKDFMCTDSNSDLLLGCSYIGTTMKYVRITLLPCENKTDFGVACGSESEISTYF